MSCSQLSVLPHGALGGLETCAFSIFITKPKNYQNQQNKIDRLIWNQ